MKLFEKAKKNNTVTGNLFKAMINALVNTITIQRFMVVDMTSGR